MSLLWCIVTKTPRGFALAPGSLAEFEINLAYGRKILKDCLEELQMTVTWTNTAGGLWTVGGNWSSDAQPGTTDDVLISLAGNYLISYPNNTGTIASLTMMDQGATLALNTGTLAITGTLALDAGTLELNGPSATEVLQGATVLANGGTAVFAGGVLSNVLWEGPLAIGLGGYVYVYGGLNVIPLSGPGPGTVDLTGIGAVMQLLGGGDTLSDVVFDLGSVGGGATLAAQQGPTLSIATGVQINATHLGEIIANTVTNQGTITVMDAATLTIDATNGVPGVSSGFNNSSGITIAPFGTLVLDGYVTLPGLGGITNQGGTLEIGYQGILDLLGGTITPSNITAFRNLTVGGTIENGTIIAASTAYAIDGELQNIRWVGVLNTTAGEAPTLDDVTVVAADGVSPGLINVVAESGIGFAAGQTVSAVTIDLGYQGQLGGDGDLTLASNVVVNVGSSAQASIYAANITNQGSLLGPTGSFGINATQVTNSGLIEGQGLTFEDAQVTNSGTIIGGGVYLGVEELINSGNITITAHETLTSYVQDYNNSGGITIGASAEAFFFYSDGNLGALTFAANAGEMLFNEPEGFDATINNWGTGDQVVLQLAAGAPYTYTVDPASTNSTLIVDQNGLPCGTLNVGSGHVLSQFTITPGTGGTYATITLSCYARGTYIDTPDGTSAIETLTEGDTVLLASGETAPIRWIGHRHIDCRSHPNPGQVWPVRVAADAFGTGLPRRDLLLSPDHAVFVDGVLIPVRCLINGDTIARIPVASVTYYHIELEQHGVLLAEGLPAESYLDTGDRANFQNGGEPPRLHPNFLARAWEARGCAPLIVTGPILAAARARLLERAAMFTAGRVSGGRLARSG
jgi:hypothetical protein